jgi:hypothetical protein
MRPELGNGQSVAALPDMSSVKPVNRAARREVTRRLRTYFELLKLQLTDGAQDFWKRVETKFVEQPEK